MARNASRRWRGLTDLHLKIIGAVLIAISTLGNTVLAEALGGASAGNMAALTVLVACEVLSWCAIPMYAWLLVQGYQHTRNVLMYGVRLTALAVISEVPYDLATSGKYFDMDSQNPVFALVVALIVLSALDWVQNHLAGAARAAANVAVELAAFLWMVLLHIGVRQQMLSMGVLIFAFVTIFHFLQDRENTMMLTAGLVGALSFLAPGVGVALLHYRNDELGYSKPWVQWLFYALYPATLLAGALLV
ncbi:ABC transporter permease [Bifidobacterium tsurumiense]|nr:ABC transporter permease [Bifidobacterium tsurumiense]